MLQKLWDVLDILPGDKTQITTLLTAALIFARQMGWVDLTDEQYESLVRLLSLAIAFFLALKIRRKG